MLTKAVPYKHLKYALISVALTLCFAQTARSNEKVLPPENLLTQFEITMGKLVIGRGEDQLNHNGVTYTLTSKTQPKGVAKLFLDEIIRESKGAITSSGVVPSEFHETGNEKRGDLSAEFDWKNKRLTLRRNESEEDVDLPKSTLDQAILPYSFSFSSIKKENSVIYLTDGKKLKKYTYEYVGDETIETTLGKLECFHFRKRREEANSRGFEFWLSKSHHNLPVKIRFIGKGERTFESTITAINYK
jgi:hypothetical protein